MKKHAYLIMIHNDFYIFERLIKLLDDKRNDIYVHLDKKVKDFDFKKYCDMVKKSKIFFTDRINVRWGDFSQIKCELLLMKTASRNGKYSYYHLLSGVDLPLKHQNEIHKFFDENKYQYVAFSDYDGVNELTMDRVRYYHFFTNNLRINNFFTKLHYKLVSYQRKIGIHRNKDVDFRKGANWFSIRDDLVRYVLSNKKLIYKLFKYSYCADEMFLQTLVYNSDFKDKLYMGNDEFDSIKRCIDWDRGQPYTYTVDDYDLLKNSSYFFARKFSSDKDKKIIDKIYESLR